MIGSSNVAQVAMRAAVNQVSSDLMGGVNHVDEIKNTAEKQAANLFKGTSSAEQEGELASVVALIGIAVAGIGIAYTAVSEQLSEVKSARLAYIKERLTGTATFVLPTNKEDIDLSNEEYFIKHFVSLSTKASFFATYSGLHSGALGGDEACMFHAVLPFYSMGGDLDLSSVGTRSIGKQRRAIGLFLKSSIPVLLADIDNYFQDESRFVSYWKSVYHGKNYLNDIRAARFMIMGLANILWNLQHPVDPATGYPLSLEECDKLCGEVELYLDKILDSAEHTRSPYLKRILGRSNTRLINFVCQVATYTQAIRAAYMEEQLHEVNISDVANGAHATIEIMNRNILNLVYTPRHSLTNGADDSAVNKLIVMVSYLRDLFRGNAGLIGMLTHHEQLDPKTTFVNNPPMTVIDAIIIFCHMSKPDRLNLISSLRASTMRRSVGGFADSLADFNDYFIRPIEKISQQELKATITKPLYAAVTSLTTSRLIPFITLTLDGYGIEVDTPSIQTYIKDNSGTATFTFLSGQQQIERINDDSLGSTAGYYKRSLAPFVTVGGKAATSLDTLLVHQHRMTQVTKLLDSVDVLFEENHDLLQQQVFIIFLLKCVKKVKDEYIALDQAVEALDQSVGEDESIPLNLKLIMRALDLDLGKRLLSLEQASRNIQQVVGAPDFIGQQKHIFIEKLDSVTQQFSALFSECSGLEGLNASNPTGPAASSTSASASPLPTDVVVSNRVIALSQLAHNCYDGLSLLSQQGYKGVLLRGLVKKIDAQPSFTDAQFKRAIIELVRLTACYSETVFFQAAYSQTRSAKIFIKAIQDPRINASLSLTDTIFGATGIDYAKLNEEQIGQHIAALGKQSSWHESVRDMGMVASF